MKERPNYKNVDKFMGKKIPENAIEKALALSSGSSEESEPGNSEQSATAPDLNGFIYVPAINLYIAKQRSCLKLNWYKTHEELDRQHQFMPTIPHFIEFIKYLKNGYTDRREAEQILDDILTVRDPWRGEWLDADFKVVNNNLNFNTVNDKLNIIYNHRFKGGSLNGHSEPLEQCLMVDKTPGIDLDSWLNNHTKQGLPKEKTKKGSLYYWHPRRDNNSVAVFDAGSGGSCLGCSGGPSSSNAALGVFACAEGASQNGGSP
jgi:hypothetical protein